MRPSSSEWFNPISIALLFSDSLIARLRRLIMNELKRFRSPQTLSFTSLDLYMNLLNDVSAELIEVSFATMSMPLYRATS